MVEVKSLASKREEYPRFSNGDTSSNTRLTSDVKSSISKSEVYTEIANATEIIDVKMVPSGVENTEKVNGEMRSGGSTSLDVNGESPRKKKRRKRKKKKKKLYVGVISNPHDNMEGLCVQSHVYGGQQTDTNIGTSFFETLTIGSIEILIDKDFANHHGVQPMRTNITKPRKILLILDVNGLLADIIHPPPKDCKSDINISRRAIFKRPFLDDFLGFCFERFDVAIWSSRTRKILDPVVGYLLGDLKKKLMFLWDLSHCTNSSARSLENRHKFIVFKKLRKFWEENGYYDESNTLLLDDSPYKALLNPKHTGIFPLSYSYKDINDNSLGPDGDLRVYLEGVAATENVKTYVKQHPFGQHDIDETSPHWAFYLEVLNNTS